MRWFQSVPQLLQPPDQQQKLLHRFDGDASEVLFAA